MIEPGILPASGGSIELALFMDLVRHRGVAGASIAAWAPALAAMLPVLV